MAYVMAGMTPYDALKTATVNPAKALGLDAGTIEPGRLADMILVAGDPLADIAALHHVRRVVANGRAYEVRDLIAGPIVSRTSTAPAQFRN
jgi:imidazolonepropionase-like amidohydrolase